MTMPYATGAREAETANQQRDELSSTRSALCRWAPFNERIPDELAQMHIAIGRDHAGFEVKQHLLTLRQELGHHVSDLGTHTHGPGADWPRSRRSKSAIRDK